MTPQPYNVKSLEEIDQIFDKAEDSAGHCSFREARRIAIKAVATACTPQWVSVLYGKVPLESTQEEDRHKEWFMILDEDDAIFKCHRQGNDYYDIDGFRRFPTHWMPLPPSPQAGGKNE